MTTKTFDQVTIEQINEAAEAAASFAFEGAEEIGTSDISCAARDACQRLGLDPDAISREDFRKVRAAVYVSLANALL